METILSVCALVISIISGGFALYAFVWTAQRDRKQATLEAYNRLQAEVFDHLNLYRPEEIREICDDRKSEKYKELSGYLARIEHFCVGINKRIYDKRTFYSLAHGYFDGSQIKSRIDPLINTKNSNGKNRELFYNDTLDVLKWMYKQSKRSRL